MVLATLTPTTAGTPTTTLPCGFKYQIYIGKKRIKTTQTAKGSFTQVTNPRINPGTQLIDWSIDMVNWEDAKVLYDLYHLEDTFTFTGFFGEEYTVEFIEFDLKQKGGYFIPSGKFRVICIDEDVDLTCPTPAP